MRTNVGGRDSLRLTQCLLDASVPLERIRQLQMRGKTERTCCTRRRIHDGGNYWKHWKGSAGQKLTKCLKSWSVETLRPQLLTGIEEDAAPTPYNSLPARCVMYDVRCTQPWRKIVPSSLPQGRSLRCERHGV